MKSLKLNSFPTSIIINTQIKWHVGKQENYRKYLRKTQEHRIMVENNKLHAKSVNNKAARWIAHSKTGKTRINLVRSTDYFRWNINLPALNILKNKKRDYIAVKNKLENRKQKPHKKSHPQILRRLSFHSFSTNCALLLVRVRRRMDRNLQKK